MLPNSQYHQYMQQPTGGAPNPLAALLHSAGTGNLSQQFPALGSNNQAAAVAAAVAHQQQQQQQQHPGMSAHAASNDPYGYPVLMNTSASAMAAAAAAQNAMPAAAAAAGNKAAAMNLSFLHQDHQVQQKLAQLEEDKIYTLVLELLNPSLREQALLDLSKKREQYEDLALVLWYSYGMGILYTRQWDRLLTLYNRSNHRAASGNCLCVSHADSSYTQRGNIQPSVQCAGAITMCCKP